MNYKTKSFMTKRKAFTLIELLIVIAIIGILFIVLVSKVDFATDKAKATGVQTDFRSFQLAFDTVAKENAGFNTFGWDTGDANQNGKRDSYDEGDNGAGGGIAKNGIQDGDEVFTGHKVYDETFTKIFSLKKNGTGSYDRDALNRLETAINANLDLKLHITIKDDGEIVMANGAQDPWNKEYHGYYITNAESDGKDRGAIVMYSDGANNEFGSEHKIANGVVSIFIPGDNKYGKDDYSIVSCYTYINGYGEILNATTGFSNNQSFLADSVDFKEPLKIIELEGNGQAFDKLLPTNLTFRSLSDMNNFVEVLLDNNTLDNSNYTVTSGSTIVSINSSYLQSLSVGEHTISIVSTDCIATGNFYVVMDEPTSSGYIVNKPYATDFSFETQFWASICYYPQYVNGTFFFIFDNSGKCSGGSVSGGTAAATYSVSNDIYTISFDKFVVTGSFSNDGTSFITTSIMHTSNSNQVGKEIVKSIDNQTFEIGTTVCVDGEYMYMYNSSTNSYKVAAFDVNTFTGTQKMRETINGFPVNTIGKIAFQGAKMTSFSVPTHITTIEESAFESCKQLRTITLHDNIQSMGSYVFRYSGIASITLPRSLTSMSNGTFYQCLNLTSVTIPTNVTTFNNGCFEGCTYLRNVYYEGSIEEWAKINFSYMSSTNPLNNGANLYINNDQLLTELILPEVCTPYAFAGCNSITKVIVPSTTKSVNYCVFSGCRSIETITFEDTNNWYDYSQGSMTSTPKLLDVSNPNNNVSVLLAQTYPFAYYSKK